MIDDKQQDYDEASYWWSIYNIVDFIKLLGYRQIHDDINYLLENDNNPDGTKPK